MSVEKIINQIEIDSEQEIKEILEDAKIQADKIMKDELEKAEQSRGIIEIELEADKLNKNIYKPSSIDAFEANTKFEPELTGKPYGLTSPDKKNLQAFPCSRSLRLQEQSNNCLPHGETNIPRKVPGST